MKIREKPAKNKVAFSRVTIFHVKNKNPNKTILLILSQLISRLVNVNKKALKKMSNDLG
jgi:hypothetical protein